MIFTEKHLWIFTSFMILDIIKVYFHLELTTHRQPVSVLLFSFGSFSSCAQPPNQLPLTRLHFVSQIQRKFCFSWLQIYFLSVTFWFSVLTTCDLTHRCSMPFGYNEHDFLEMYPWLFIPLFLVYYKELSHNHYNGAMLNWLQW